MIAVCRNVKMPGGEAPDEGLRAARAMLKSSTTPGPTRMRAPLGRRRPAPGTC